MALLLALGSAPLAQLRPAYQDTPVTSECAARAPPRRESAE